MIWRLTVHRQGFRQAGPCIRRRVSAMRHRQHQPSGCTGKARGPVTAGAGSGLRVSRAGIRAPGYPITRWRLALLACWGSCRAGRRSGPARDRWTGWPFARKRTPTKASSREGSPHGGAAPGQARHMEGQPQGRLATWRISSRAGPPHGGPAPWQVGGMKRQLQTTTPRHQPGCCRSIDQGTGGAGHGRAQNSCHSLSWVASTATARRGVGDGGRVALVLPALAAGVDLERAGAGAGAAACAATTGLAAGAAASRWSV